MFLKTDLGKAWDTIAHPVEFFEQEQGARSYWPVLRFYLALNCFLAVLTPLVNWFGIPSDIVHAGTNAQMGAYVIAPGLELVTGVSRYIWVGLVTYTGNIAKFPILGLIFHVFAKLLRGKGTILDSFKVSIYATSPMLLFGWIPFFGLITGLWTGYLYVVALNRLHEVELGPAIALINVMIGIQLVWAFLFGWMGSSMPW